MRVRNIIIWILISGCSCITLPGLSNVQTDDKYTKVFGIVQDKKIFSKIGRIDTRTSTVSPHINYAGESLKQQPSGQTASGSRDNMAATLHQLSGMSALQLLQVLGLHLSSNSRGNNYEYASQHVSGGNEPRIQPFTNEASKPIIQSSHNNEEKSPHNIQLSLGHQTHNTDTSVKRPTNGVQKINNADSNIKQTINRFNSQQQTSPIFMMSSGMGGQRFPQVSNVASNQQNGLNKMDNKDKLFDPDALMQHMMMSSSASLGTGKYDLKQNISPQNWVPSTKHQSVLQNTGGFGSMSNTFNPLNSQKPGSSFNPDSFSNVKMNFMPNALMLGAGKSSPKLNVKLSYNANKVNDYKTRFNPGQMFPVVRTNTPTPTSGSLFPVVHTNTPTPTSGPLFNADTLNRKLMDSQNLNTYSNDQNVRPLETVFGPGLLISASEPEFQTDHTIDGMKPRVLLENNLFDLPIERENTTKNDTGVNITTSPPDSTTILQTEFTTITTPSTKIDNITKVQTESMKNESSLVDTVSSHGQSSNGHNGFVPGSLTGDGQSLQMMMNMGMFNPNKVNTHAFVMSNNNKNVAVNTNEIKTEATMNGFNMAYNYNPSVVNQAKVSFNTNQQMGMPGSSEANFNTFFDPNKANKNSFINPFDKSQNSNNNMPSGMFDNSQFLGKFDPNSVNLISINDSQHSGFGGNFNPTEVNKAYFNPDVVNEARMNFNPSEMLEKNPGYHKETAESYKFDPNKVNDIHMNFLPRFLKDGRNLTDGNSTAARFVPGLLSGGRDESQGMFDLSKMKMGIMFNPLNLMNEGQMNEQSKNESKLDGSTDGSHSGVMFNPSSMIGNMDGLIKGNKFDPNTENKVDLQFNPNKIMEQMFPGKDNTENKNTDTKTELGHGNHDTV